MHMLDLRLPACQPPRPYLSTALCAVYLAIIAAIAGCGGPPRAEATAIPASVVRPVQPAPHYPGGADVFSLLTPEAAAQFVPTAAAEDALAIADETSSQQRAAIKLFIENQTPSAVGIAPGGAAIYAERGGRTLASVPVGGVLTVTGKSADGAWYSVYNEGAVFGWVPAGQLRVFGGEDLVVVEEAPDPAPVATLLAQAAQPVRVLDELMAQFDATATEIAKQPTAAPPALISTPTPAGEASLTADSAPQAMPALAATPTTGAVLSPEPGAQSSTGVVSSEGRLNVRSAPDTAAAIVRKLDPGAAVTIVERNPDNTWLRLEFDDGASGWVSAEFITPDR
jgi:hypothetical protein